MHFYAGIGSRRATDHILTTCYQLGVILDQQGYTLRSGRAEGCDTAFELGAKESGVCFPELFKSKDAMLWAYEEVKKHLPNDRSGFDTWSPHVKGLLARNMMQVLGRNGDEPVKFVLCWAPSLYYEDSSAGGTGYAIRCALAHNIPVYNLFDDNVYKHIVSMFNIET